MKSIAKIIAVLALTGLLNACAMNTPAITETSTTAIKPQAQADRKIDYIPPPKLPSQWTVEDILQSYSAYATRKLTTYFAKSKVSYPPREVIFIALNVRRQLSCPGDDNYPGRF